MSILIYKVSKSLGNLKILDRVSLYVPKYSLLALLGPSGSGKSSLLRIIAGLDNCDYGNIWLHGINVTNVSTQYRRMSFVFQHYALFKHMTVYDNISFGLRLRGFSAQKITNKVNDLLNCLRIADISFEYPAQLSGGQKQRVALARSLAIQPDFLLLDEPFGALDGELRRHLSKWLKRYLQDNKITTIMVTHDQKEAISMADEIVILKEGRLLQQGKPKNLYDQPINFFVGIFLGLLIEIPKLNESITLKNIPSKTPQNLKKFAFDPIWVKIFANRSINKYRFFLRPYEFCIKSEMDLEATPVQIKTIIYKRTFVQLDLFVTSFLWNLTIPIGYQSFRNLHIESFMQILYIKPRLQVFLRAYPILTNIKNINN
ncbi:sulfate ABC transporter protein (chloroplast) [Marchantia polymorpha subsp. ruderalis]|uniref:Sulfate ABC transporter protein n=3 Tax=Marchantia polymorpha TaxID=3197 RepID=A0A2Z6DT43_MARPO|nr:sulfate ABC transporter protein [Marchantia polymorpha subsp. ruderalis]YP_009646807.1 sulfate ABC transporter protein [Marchantia polymorpha]AET50438.1 sulfate/thiosulfate import ATP-binding protein CysA [Marchantia polymorpha]AXJ93209.1 sulfate ABC transporter protein [Marchantia polymorpha subsp. ruderalis]AZU95186.1 sulfate ABC transporter protein [Marchantia polymorpha]QBE89574.1 sulfate ABC transporter protein [Marchantia polymorpha subsp. ruderalis]BBD75072.1 sulfate ABC transporter